MATGIGSPLALGGLYPSVDGRYVAANGKPFTSVSNAESALNGFPSKLSESCVGLTVLVADENDPDYPKAKEYWVQPKGTTPETYGLVEKGAGTTDYTDLDNKPTISDGGQGSTQIPLSGNVKVTAKAATSGQTTGVEVTAENGEITMAFTLEKGKDGTNGINGKSAYQVWLDEGNEGTEVDFLNSLKAHVSTFVPVAYNATAAGISVGQTYDFALQSPIDGSMVIMPNAGSAATGSIMYAVSVNEGVATYTRVGDVSIDASNFLSFSNVDGTVLKNPTTSQVAKATDVMGLMAKLEGVTASEAKASNYMVADGFIACRATGSRVVKHYYTNSTRKTALIPIGISKAVRFLGFKANYDDPIGYVYMNIDNISTFLAGLTNNQDLSSYIVSTNPYEKDTNIQELTEPVEILSDNQEDANYIALFYDTDQSSDYSVKDTNFYCYVRSGESAGEMINKLDNDIVQKTEFIETERVTGYTTSNKYIDSGGKWQSYTGFNCAIAPVNNGDVIRLNAAEGGLSNGFYALLTSATVGANGTSVSFAQDFPSRFTRSAYEDSEYMFTVPNDGTQYYLYKQTKGSVTYGGTEDIITIVPIKDKIPNVVDNLESTSPTDALSAKQGSVLREMVQDLNADIFGGEKNLEVIGEIDLNSGKVGTYAYFATGSYRYQSGQGNRSYYYELNVPQSDEDIYLRVYAGEHNCYVTLLSSNDGLSSNSTPSYASAMNGVARVKISAGNYFDIKLSDDCEYVVFYNKDSNTADGYYMPSSVKYITKEVVESKINASKIGITHLVPDNEGQLNVVRRMRKISDIEYTPAFDFSRLSSGGGASCFRDVFKAGVTYKGIPYSRSYHKMAEYGYKRNASDYTGFKIGFYISLETFMTALSNRGTVMEIESVFGHSASTHNSSFYSNICAGSVSAALGVGYLSTDDFTANTPPTGFTKIGEISSSFNFSLLKLGDAMAKPGVHTVMVTDVIKDNNGDITHIEITESTTAGNANFNVIGGKSGGVARRLWWTIEDFPIQWDGYWVLRYNNISNVKYIPSPYVPMPDEQKGYASYTMAVLPYMGNRFRYVSSASQLDNILKLIVTVKERVYSGGNGNVTIDDKTHIIIEKYDSENEVWEEIGEESIDYTSWNDDTHPYVYVSLANDVKYKEIGEYRAFAYVNRTYDETTGKYVYSSSDTQSDGKTARCYWSVVESITLLTDY